MKAEKNRRKKIGKIREYLLWYTQFSDTCEIGEKDLVRNVNDTFGTNYQLNRFQDIYIDKMPDSFSKNKDADGYFVYKRIDIKEPEFTVSEVLELESYSNEQKWYDANEDFLTYLDYARRTNDIEFENHILSRKLVELWTERRKE